MKNYLLLLMLIIVSGCSNRNQSNADEINLTANKVPLYKVFSPDFMTRVGDKLLISSSFSDTLLHIFSLPSLKHLNSSSIKGSGPDDFQLFPMFCESADDNLYIWGFNPLTIKKFSIDQDGILNCKKLIKLSQYAAFNNMSIVNDSLFIYYLPDLLKIVKSDLKNNKDLDEIQMKKDDHNESFFYTNRGYLAANDSFLLYGYLFKKQIDIYRIHDFKLKKKVEGDYKFKNPILGDFNTIVYYKKIVAGKHFFYALCSENQNKNAIMEVYDYNGLLVRKYTFDIPPQLFVIDEENHEIYGYNDLYEDYLLYYKFSLSSN